MLALLHFEAPFLAGASQLSLEEIIEGRSKKLAKPHGISKHKVDECLDRGPYERCPGKGNSTLYTIMEQTPAASDFPISPAPKERENENSTVPVEVVA
jgi:hypothetical protein